MRPATHPPVLSLLCALCVVVWCVSDRTARLWSTDRVSPLRLFVGHSSDVDVVRFHPNAHYLATGSSDRSLRLWDIAQGQSARTFIGHQAEVTALTFDQDGRYLYSAAADGRWIQFDIASARIVTQGRSSAGQRPTNRAAPASPQQQLLSRQQSITSLTVSGEGELLATGALSGVVSVWGINRGEGGGSSTAQAGAGGARHGSGGSEGGPLREWRAKSSAITHLHFSPRNLLLACATMR